MSNSSNHVKPMSLKSFYGQPKLRDVLRLNKSIPPVPLPEQKHIIWKASLPRRLRSLVGPSQTWRVFKKQQEALEFAQSRQSELMTFVYQEFSEERTFLVVHPTVFWYYDVKRNPEERCSFEIIPLYSVCKLYFDLEFEREPNKNSDGTQMTETFITIVNYFLQKVWGLDIDRSYILDMDSTTKTKFSRHLIYNLPNVAFRDNYHVGNFVKSVCLQVRNYILGLSTDLSAGQSNIINFDDICSKYRIDHSSIHELLILDNKGKQKLFCDEGVYTKNRHFRLFCSTKRNKNSPLVLSPENQYKFSCFGENNLDLFLDSLITYFPSNSSCMNVIEYGTTCPKPDPIENGQLGYIRANSMSSTETKSPHQEVDHFISTIVSPGRISRWVYFSSSNALVYDIIGYRYCNNIQRRHRSNNIKFVVYLSTGLYYQKCYDPDCAGYRSKELKLPSQVVDLYSEEENGMRNSNQETSTGRPTSTFQSTFGSFGVQEEVLSQVLDAVEDSNKIIEVDAPWSRSSTSNSVDKTDLTDDLLMQVMETIVVQDSRKNLVTGFKPSTPVLNQAVSASDEILFLQCCNQSDIKVTEDFEVLSKVSLLQDPVSTLIVTNKLMQEVHLTAKKSFDLKNSIQESKGMSAIALSRVSHQSDNLNVITNEEFLDVMTAIEDSREMCIENSNPFGSKPDFTNDELVEIMEVVEGLDIMFADCRPVPNVSSNVFTDHTAFPDFGILDSQLLEINHPNLV